jgi:hypothetical protein
VEGLAQCVGIREEIWDLGGHFVVVVVMEDMVGGLADDLGSLGVKDGRRLYGSRAVYTAEK